MRETEVYIARSERGWGRIWGCFSVNMRMQAVTDTKGGNCEDTGTDDRNGAQSDTSDAE
jgi:hypothetical protein